MVLRKKEKKHGKPTPSKSSLEVKPYKPVFLEKHQQVFPLLTVQRGVGEWFDLASPRLTPDLLRCASERGIGGDRQWESVLVLITASHAFTLTVNTLAWASVCCCSACVLCDPDGVTMASWPMGLFAYSGACSVVDLGKDWRANSRVYMCIA